MAQCTQRGITLLFASHNLGQVKRLATRVVCLDAGRVVADQTVADFFNTPQSVAVRNFMQGDA